MAVFSRFLAFFGAVCFIMTHIYGQTKYILPKNCPHISFPCCREAPNILHPLLKRPHRLLNWQIQVTRVSWVGQSTMFQVKGRVEWMEGWYATPFMGAIFPCGKDIHHEMFSRLWNAWKWINRQMALHPCNRPEILLAHVFVQDIMQIRGKFQKLSFSFKVDERKAATWLKYLFIIYDATQYSFQMTCNQKLHP